MHEAHYLLMLGKRQRDVNKIKKYQRYFWKILYRKNINTSALFPLREKHLYEDLFSMSNSSN